MPKLLRKVVNPSGREARGTTVNYVVHPIALLVRTSERYEPVLPGHAGYQRNLGHRFM